MNLHGERHALPWSAALGVALVAVFTKLALTAGPLLPGLDGAYYWVQVRALLDRGTLAFTDLPLLFWFQAGLAGLGQMISGQRLDEVIPAVVRLTDAVLPSLTVLPLLVLSKRLRQPWFAPVLTLAVLFHPVQLYFFTGDFLKNEAALPLALALGVLLATGPNQRPWLAVAVGAFLLGATALTHFGVLLLCATLLVVWLVARWLGWTWKPRLAALAAVAVAVMVVGGLLWWLAPSRFDRLVAAVGDAGSLFRTSVWELAGYGAANVNGSLLFAAVSGQLGTLALAGLAWWRRKDFDTTSGTALVAFLVTAFTFSSPLLGIEWFDRLVALSFVPLTLAAALLAGRVTGKPARAATWSVGASLAGATLVIALLLSPQGATAPAVKDATWQELQALAESHPVPENSLVVARHGVEFLVAWLWQTDVVQDRYAGPEASLGYNASYLLLDKADEAKGRLGPPKQDKGPPPPEGLVEVLYDSPALVLMKLP